MDEGVTSSEVYRHLLKLSDQLNRIECMVIPRSEFEAYKLDVDRRLTIDAESTEKDVSALHMRIDGVLSSQHETQREQFRQSKEFNAKIWVAVIGASVSVIGSIFLTIIN